MKKVKLLDTFAGIGGFHLGVKQACEELGIDFECVGAIEFDKHAQETYRNNFPNTPLLGQEVGGDITKIDLTKLPEHNLLCGGFPCQPFSQARKNKEKTVGLNAECGDDRAYLYSYLCKILKIKQPEMFIFENVPGLLKEKKNNETTLFIENIVNDIKQCGYSVQYKVLNSKDYSAPQNRERVYFVGYRNDISLNKPLILDHIPKSLNPKFIIDILEDEKNIDKKYYLENLWTKNNKIQQNNPGTKYEAILKSYNNSKKPHPTTTQHKVVQTAVILNDTPSNVSRQGERVYSCFGLSPTLTCTIRTNISLDDKNPVIMRQLTPRECARIQCFPDSFKLPIKDGNSYKQFGNAVCVNVINQLGQYLLINLL